MTGSSTGARTVTAGGPAAAAASASGPAAASLGLPVATGKPERRAWPRPRARPPGRGHYDRHCSSHDSGGRVRGPAAAVTVPV